MRRRAGVRHRVCIADLDVPLAAVLVVVVLVVLLDGHVGEVDERVVHLAHLAVVLGGAEPAESKSNARAREQPWSHTRKDSTQRN